MPSLQGGAGTSPHRELCVHRPDAKEGPGSFWGLLRGLPLVTVLSNQRCSDGL